MKNVLIALVLILTAPSVSAEEVNDYRYELENIINSSSAGYVTLKVWSYGRRQKLTKNKCMANAIHGILFKGLDADETGTTGSLAPMVSGGYESNAQYFDEFFKQDYMLYIQETSKGAMTAGDIIKLKNKKEYKIGMVVKINLNALRKRLENDGVLKSVQGIFEM